MQVKIVIFRIITFTYATICADITVGEMNDEY